MTNTDNLIHSIAITTGIEDEKKVRTAALAVTDFYIPGNYTQEQLLEIIYLYLADGQEERAIIHEFRSKLQNMLEEGEE